MPTISVYENDLNEKLKKKLNENELDDLCFEFGLEIDEIEIKNNEKIYKIEVPANRYDLICIEGISRALNNFLGFYENINYKLISEKNTCINNYVINVEESVDQKRPYVLGFILKNINMNERIYNNIIELQEKLHHNIGKKRSILAIGIHNYDAIKFPIYYKFEEKENINFIPLNEKNILNGNDVINFYKKNINLKHYVELIKNFDKFPIITDADNKIISLPPLINCEHTRITPNTKNIFIECTCTDKRKGEIAINILSSILSEYCNDKYTIDCISVCYNEKHILEKGNKFIYPKYEDKTIKCNMDYIKKLSGIYDLTIEMTKDLLKKMMLPIKNIENDYINVIIPFYRSDIMHCCDIIEDICIAYGYSNIKPIYYDCANIYNLNNYSNIFKDTIIECGYTEVMTYTLLSLKENYDYMLKKEPHTETDIKEYNMLVPPVKILNSKSLEYEIVRTSLIVNLLKFLSFNKHRELPIRIFEIGDIVFCCQNKTDTNAINKRHLGILFSDKTTSGFEEIHGILETVLSSLNLYSDYKIDEKKKENIFIRSDIYYKLIPKEDSSFLKERIVDIVLFPHNLKFGIMGIIHPKVLENFSIDIPVSIIEIDIEFLYNYI